MTNSRSESTRFLRRALEADAVVSGLCGLGLLAVPGPIAAFIGLRSSAVVAVVGLSLVVYGAALLRNARRERPSRAETVTTIALNVAWVLASIAVIGAGWLNREGNWALVLVGDVVLAAAILEGIGLRRMKMGSMAEVS
jgi:hypothetical protein